MAVGRAHGRDELDGAAGNGRDAWKRHDRPGGPGSTASELGTLGWFVVTWIVMMAAMMFPSLAPTVALYARVTRRRGTDRALLFAGGYLLVWGAAGAVAYGAFEAGRSLFGQELAWNRAGSAVAAGVVALAALYQFTP